MNLGCPIFVDPEHLLNPLFETRKSLLWMKLLQWLQTDDNPRALVHLNVSLWDRQ